MITEFDFLLDPQTETPRLPRHNLGTIAEWRYGSSTISITVLLVTPELAERWLDGHVNYRNERPNRVERYTGEMEADNWQLTGDAIRFVGNSLVDGRHRLRSCIKSGRSFLTVVMHIQPDAASVIDRGLARTSADEMRSKGFAHAAVVASASALVNCWYAGKLADRANYQNTTPPFVFEQFALEHAEAMEEAALTGRDLYRETKLRPALGAAMAYILNDHDPDNATTFLESLVTGTNLDADDPIFVLRRWIMNRNLNKMRFSEEEFFGVVAKAWNAWRRGESVKLLKFTPTGKGEKRTKIPALL